MKEINPLTCANTNYFGKNEFCHLLLSGGFETGLEYCEIHQKGPTFRLVSHNERLVGETFPIPILLHIYTQTVQDLKSPVALTVWQ